jgi:hypothetical protein
MSWWCGLERREGYWGHHYRLTGEPRCFGLWWYRPTDSEDGEARRAFDQTRGYLLNHSKEEQICLAKCDYDGPGRVPIDPLPMLTANGPIHAPGGLTAGSTGEGSVGLWSYDLLEWSRARHGGYKEVEHVFRNDSPDRKRDELIVIGRDGWTVCRDDELFSMLGVAGPGKQDAGNAGGVTGREKASRPSGRRRGSGGRTWARQTGQGRGADVGPGGAKGEQCTRTA